MSVTTNRRELTQIDSQKSGLLFKEEVFLIVGSAMDVLNQIGHGFHENALVVEFRLRNIPFQQQKPFPLIYKAVRIAECIPDLIAFDAIIIDTKTIDRITDIERGQILNYLRITKLRVGAILNFKNPKLEWERIIL